MRPAFVTTVIVFSTLTLAVQSERQGERQEGADELTLVPDAVVAWGQGGGDGAALKVIHDEEARRLGTMDIDNLSGGTSSHVSTMNPTSWNNHMFDVTADLPGSYSLGVDITIDMLHFRVSGSAEMGGSMRLGYFSSDTTLQSGYIFTTFSVISTTILGESGYFAVGDFGGQSFTPSDTLWVQIYVTSGSNSRSDVGPATYTSTYYQTGASRTGHPSFNLAYGLECDPGFYMSGETCTACPAGAYSASSSNAATSCTSCAAGAFAATTGATSCSACAAGTFAATAGATTCADCAAGSSQPNAGSASCASCAAGTFEPSAGSASCSACPDGRYQPSTGAATCAFCPAETYQPGFSAEACLTCPAGQFQPMTGQVSCQATPAPTAAPSRNTPSPSTAPTTSPSMGHVTTVNHHRVSSPVLRTELLILNGVAITSIDGAARRLSGDDGRELEATKLLLAEIAAVLKTQQVTINELKESNAEYDLVLGVLKKSIAEIQRDKGEEGSQ